MNQLQDDVMVEKLLGCVLCLLHYHCNRKR